MNVLNHNFNQFNCCLIKTAAKPSMIISKTMFRSFTYVNYPRGPMRVGPPKELSIDEFVSCVKKWEGRDIRLKRPEYHQKMQELNHILTKKRNDTLITQSYSTSLSSKKEEIVHVLESYKRDSSPESTEEVIKKLFELFKIQLSS